MLDSGTAPIHDDVHLLVRFNDDADVPKALRLALADAHLYRVLPGHAERGALTVSVFLVSGIVRRQIRERLLPAYAQAPCACATPVTTPVRSRSMTIVDTLPLLAADLTFVKVNGGRAFADLVSWYEDDDPYEGQRVLLAGGATRVGNFSEQVWGVSDERHQPRVTG